jgi:hypothetical protein
MLPALRRLALGLILAALAAAGAAALTFPPLAGRVVDQAGLLGERDTAELDAALARFEQASGGRQLVVATIADRRACRSRTLRLPARPALGDRPGGPGQRRPAARRAQRAGGADRGRLRPGGRADRCAQPHDHRDPDPAALAGWRLCGRDQGRRCGDHRGAGRPLRAGSAAQARARAGADAFAAAAGPDLHRDHPAQPHACPALWSARRHDHPAGRLAARRRLERWQGRQRRRVRWQPGRGGFRGGGGSFGGGATGRW